MVKQKVLDLSQSSYYDFISDLLYIEAGLQKIAQNEVFVFSSKTKLCANCFWDAKRDCNVTDSGIYFVFTFDKNKYYSYKDITLKVIFSKFRNLDNLNNYLREAFGLIADNLIFSNDMIYRKDGEFCDRILTFRNLKMNDILRLKALVNEHKFMRNRYSNMFYILDKDRVCNSILNNDLYYNKVLEYLIGDSMRTYGSYSVKVMGRNTLVPVIYFGDSNTEIEMVKNRLLKYLPVDCIEIVERDAYQYIFPYKISLKLTKSIFMSIFHDIYTEELDFNKLDNNLRISAII